MTNLPESDGRECKGAKSRPLRFHVRNTVSGLLVPSDDRRTPREFAWSFDAKAWVTRQLRPQDFEVVQAEWDDGV